MPNSAPQSDARLENPTSTTGIASPPPPVEAGDDDVFDPSEYVKDLIARMDGKGASTAASKPIASAPVPSKTPPQTTVATDRASAEYKPAKRATRAEEIGVSDNIPIDPRQPRSKSQPPVNLEKLREAANITSSSDLNVSACHVFVRRAYVDFTIAVTCLAVVLVMLSLARGMYSVAYLASTVALAIACVATIRFFTITNALWTKLREQSNVPVEVEISESIVQNVVEGSTDKTQTV